MLKSIIGSISGPGATDSATSLARNVAIDSGLDTGVTSTGTSLVSSIEFLGYWASVSRISRPSAASSSESLTHRSGVRPEHNGEHAACMCAQPEYLALSAPLPRRPIAARSPLKTTRRVHPFRATTSHEWRWRRSSSRFVRCDTYSASSPI